MTKPQISRNHSLPIIWLLPLLATMIGGWLVYQDMEDAGVEVSVTFDNAEGIKQGLTKVIYKGIQVGLVKELHISKDMQQVKVIAELNNEIKSSLTKTTEFWLVKPKISLTGITGLDTLVAGNYIQMRLGAKGKFQKNFIALTKPPLMKQTTSGLYLNILTDKLNSIDRGSLVYYREIPVGRVVDYHLTDNLNKGVVLKLRIKEDYRHLVKANTRFWNTSGISITAGLSGVSIKTGSLATIIAGGIAFYTPDGDLEAQESSLEDTFKLYVDFDSAQVGILVKIYFKSAAGLQAGRTEIKYKGFKIGLIKTVTHQHKTGKVLVEAMFDPSAETYLNSGSKFWLAKPKFSLAALNGLSSLMQGNYVDMLVGKGDLQREFTALNKPPLLSNKQGLNLVLKGDSLNSLEQDSPILFKRIPVGRVHDYRLSDNGKQVLIDISIDESYKHLVKANSRFWNVSGVQMQFDSSGLKLRTGTVNTLLAGGIAFISPDSTKNSKIKNHQQFTLYNNYEEATDNGRLVTKKTAGDLTLKLQTQQLGSLSQGSKVYYQKIPVGELSHYQLRADNSNIILTLTIKKAYKNLIHQQTQFWRDSGIKVDAGFSGIKLQTPSLKALINGGISFDTPKNSQPKPIMAKQYFNLFDSQELAQQQGLKIHVKFNVADGLNEATVVKYRGINVGKVTKLQLSKNNQYVNAEILLQGSAQDFARTGTKFWLVGASLGLFNTKNLETLIQGKYIAILPATGAKTQQFTALSKAPKQQGLAIQLKANKLGSIKVGQRLYYRQLPVGIVNNYQLASTATHVVVNATIDATYAKLVRAGSKFWDVSGIKVDVGLFSGTKIRTESAETLLAGGIAFATPKNSPNAKEGAVFILNEELDEDWLEWSPIIHLAN